MDITKNLITKGLQTPHVINLASMEVDDILTIIRCAKAEKIKKAVGEHQTPLKGKFLASLSKLSHISGRLALEMAVKELGGNMFNINLTGSEIEEVLRDKDTIKSLASLDIAAMVVNTAIVGDAENIMKIVDLPIISTYACSVLSMFMTVSEIRGKLTDVKLAVVGNLNKTNFSIINGAVKCGMEINIVTPEENVDTDLLNSCKPYGDVKVFHNLKDGLNSADVVYVLKDNGGFTIDKTAINYAKPNAILLSLLPFDRDVSITSEVADSINCHIQTMAKNLLFTVKAALLLLLQKS